MPDNEIKTGLSINEIRTLAAGKPPVVRIHKSRTKKVTVFLEGGRQDGRIVERVYYNKEDYALLRWPDRSKTWHEVRKEP